MKIFYVGVLCLMSAVHTQAVAQIYPPKSTDMTPEQIYKNNCSVCHGDNGDGRSRASSSLIPPPRNFTAAGELTREKMIATVTHGKPGTAMTSWKTRFTPAQIESVVDYVRTRFMQSAIQTHLTFGRMVYGHNCKSCHGEQGQGVLAAGLSIAPRSFSTPRAATELSHDYLFEIVARGIPKTAMLGFSNKIPDEHIHAVVDFVRAEFMVATPTFISSANNTPAGIPLADMPSAATSAVDMNLPMPKNLIGNAHLGGQFFMGNCATCHGMLGNGQGPRSTFMAAKPRNFLDDFSRAALNRPAIFSAVTLGRVGTEMPAWGQVLSDQEIANVTEFVFQNFIQKKSAP